MSLSLTESRQEHDDESSKHWNRIADPVVHGVDDKSSLDKC